MGVENHSGEVDITRDDDVVGGEGGKVGICNKNKIGSILKRLNGWRLTIITSTSDIVERVTCNSGCFRETVIVDRRNRKVRPLRRCGWEKKSKSKRYINEETQRKSVGDPTPYYRISLFYS